jgi:hypothetical protein
MTLSMGILFALLHYAMALQIFLTGAGVYVLACLPMKYKVCKAKNTGESPLNKVIPALIIIILFFAYGNRSTGKSLIDYLIYTDLQTASMHEAADTACAHSMKEINLNKNQFPAMVARNYDKAIRVQRLCDEMIAFLSNCKLEAIAKTNDLPIGECNFELAVTPGLNKSEQASLYFCGPDANCQTGKAGEIKQRLHVLNDSIRQIMESDSLSLFEIPFLNAPLVMVSENKEIPWEEAMFKDIPLIADLTYLDQLSLAVKQSEQRLLSVLLSDARSEILWVYWDKYKALTPGSNTK